MRNTLARRRRIVLYESDGMELREQRRGCETGKRASLAHEMRLVVVAVFDGKGRPSMLESAIAQPVHHAVESHETREHLRWHTDGGGEPAFQLSRRQRKHRSQRVHRDQAGA